MDETLKRIVPVDSKNGEKNIEIERIMICAVGEQTMERLFYARRDRKNAKDYIAETSRGYLVSMENPDARDMKFLNRYMRLARENNCSLALFEQKD